MERWIEHVWWIGVVRVAELWDLVMVSWCSRFVSKVYVAGRCYWIAIVQ